MTTEPGSPVLAGGAARVRRVSDAVLVAAFLVALSVPLARLNRPDAERAIEEIELRRAAPFPEVEFRGKGLLKRPKLVSIRVFPSKFEAWFNDHVGGRRQLIRLYNLATVCGLTTSNLGRTAVGLMAHSRVIVGLDGWLFWGEDHQIDDYRCMRPFSPEQLALWRNTLEARRDWLARRGIRYLVYVVPNQQTVYAECMPRSLTRVGSQSRLDQLLATLDHPGGISVLDGRARLTAAKSQWPTYHKTDNHWNDFGAFIGYEQMFKTMSDWFPQLHPRRLDGFEVQVTDAPGKDMARIVDLPIPFRERLVTLTPREPRRAQVAHLPPLSDGSISHCTTQPNGELPTAVVLHDSFVMALEPFVSEHFERVRYVWTHDFPIDVIAAEHPCVVIQELVEWKMMVYEPSNPVAMGGPAGSDNVANRPGEDRR